MLRTDEAELLDGPDVPDELVERAYRDIANIHRYLGDVRLIARLIRNDRQPVRRVMDIGCGTGVVLHHLARVLDVDAVGADIRPRHAVSAPVPIVSVDACIDPLPQADVAFCMYLCHHMGPGDVVRLIRNAGRYCRRFILLDLVRHALPLTLFRLFVAPLICDIDAEDGRRSIRRSYTPRELRELTAQALDGSNATFRASVAPFWVRQVIDISYGDSQPHVAAWNEALPQEDECLR